jgi:hypothetical protein
MTARSSQNSGTSTALIVILLVFTFPLWIGLVGGLFGMIIGLIGGAFGLVGGLFGAVFGIIGDIFGTIFGAIGDGFGSLFDWGFHPFHISLPKLVWVVAVVLLVVALSRKKS